MADLINDNKRKTAGGDLRLGSTSNPPDALPSVEAPIPVDLPAKQSIPVPPPDAQQVSKVSSSPPSITAPPARQPVMAVHLDPAEDAQVAAETASIREAANDPLPGDAIPQPFETTFATTDATFPTVRGTDEQYSRPQEMTAEQAASAYLQPDANKAAAAAQLERAISNEAINKLGPDDFIPYMINQPELRNLVAESAQQRQSIFAQYTNENKQNADYAAALTAQVEADRQAKNSSTSDGLDWVRTIVGQRDGVRKYNAPVQFNQQTQQYDTNLLGAILYPLGVIQNTAIGAALDGRQLIRQLGNVIPPQHREFADRFIRRTPLFKQLGVAQWVLNGNKYDDGKSNIIEAIRGAQYSFSDDTGEGVGIGVQTGAFKTPKLPIVGEVGVNPSKLLGFAGDVFIGAKLDKVVSAAAKRLGIGVRAVPPPPAASAVSVPKRPQLPPSPRSPIQAPGSAVKQRPRQLPPASQQVVVLPPPRRAYTPQTRLPATAPRKLLMPSRVAELRSPLNATPKEKLQLLKPVVAKHLQPLKLPAKVKEQQDVITAILEVPVTKVLPVISKATSPVVKLIKEQLNQTEWWGTPQGTQLATHLDDLLTAAPQKVEAALEKAGVDVEQLRQVVDDIVPTQDATNIISEAQQALPKVDPVSDAVNESLVAQQLKDGISTKRQQVIAEQADTLDIGRRELDEELLATSDIAVDAPKVKTTVDGIEPSAPQPVTSDEQLMKLYANKGLNGTLTVDDLKTVFPGDEIATLLRDGKLISGTGQDGNFFYVDAVGTSGSEVASYSVQAVTKFFKASGQQSESILQYIAKAGDNVVISDLLKATGLSRGEAWANLFSLERADKLDLASLGEGTRFTAQQVNDGLAQNIGGPLFYISRGEKFDTVATKVAKTIEAPAKTTATKVVKTAKKVQQSTPPDVLPLKSIKNAKAYHGTRAQNLDLAAINPITGSARHELGTGIYTYGSKSKAAMPAKADVSLNLPDVPERTFGDGVIHQLELNGNVLDGKAEIPVLRDLALSAAQPELRAAIEASSSSSIVGILDNVSAATTEEAALTFQRRFMQVLRDNDVQHIKAGGITSTIDPKGIVTKSVTPVKGASDGLSPEVMLRNRLKMELDATQQTESQFMKSTTLDTMVRAESQALDSAAQQVEAAQLKTYDAVKRSGLLDDVVPQPRDLSVTTPSQATSRADDVISRYVETAKRSSDDYIAGIAEGRVPAKRGENFTALVRDILDGHVDDPKLISLLEGKYAKLYDSVADKIYNESYSKLLPSSVKQVSTAIDDIMAEISTHPPDSVPPELQSKLDDLLDQIDDEAFDRKFNDALKSETPSAKNADNPSSPCDI